MTKRNYIQKLFFLCAPIMLCAISFANTSPWQGSYVGAFLAGDVGYDYAATDVGAASSTNYFQNTADVNAVNNSGTSIFHPIGAVAGIQIGHNWMDKKYIVFGAVFDVSSLSLNATNTQNNITYASSSDQFSIETSLKTSWLMTLRGILGCSINKSHLPTMLYGTAGMAITQMNINDSFSDNSALQGLGTIHSNLYNLGVALGAGVNVAAIKHTFFNIEYLFVYMPSMIANSTITNSAAGFGIPLGSQTSSFAVTNRLDINLLKAGISYHFSA
ncbi:MAG TPA: hypothetical protein VJK30_06120 [Coxiellaceae bacterium]|nr:MAG: hypothetical protein A3E81_06080 [Gammaproteobacteria bacterium RIFCSPHIGHO2_12_FULL_36_30]HLB56883.1 hypothetical protein [Coxiellaceae bacterium]